MGPHSGPEPPAKPSDDELRELAEKDHPIPEIAKITGVDQRYIRKRLKRMEQRRVWSYQYAKVRRTSAILYLALYFAMATVTTSAVLTQGYPTWFATLIIACGGCGMVCMYLYIMRWRLEALSLFWKLLPIFLVVVETSCWLYDFFALGHADPGGTPLIIWLVAISPSWYLCFRYGYVKAFDEDWDTTRKVLRRIGMVFFVLGVSSCGMSMGVNYEDTDMAEMLYYLWIASCLVGVVLFSGGVYLELRYRIVEGWHSRRTRP